MPAERVVTLFDVDNTLVAGFSLMHFAEFLTSKKIISESGFSILTSDLDSFKKHQDYRKFADEVVDDFYLLLSGQDKRQIVKAGMDFLPVYKSHLFPYSIDLVNTMNKVSETVAISGAPKEAFLPLAKELGINEQKSQLLEGYIFENLFLGRTLVNMALSWQKSVAIAMLGEYNFEKSFAFGDSIHDLPILEAVGNPFVVESSAPELAEYGREKHWPIVSGSNILQVVSQRLVDLKLL